MSKKLVPALCPEDRTSLPDLMALLMTILPFSATLKAMLSGGPFSPAPSEAVNHSNEMRLRELTGLEKGLYSIMCDLKNRRYIPIQVISGYFWKIVWGGIDIKCPHGIAIRDDYQVVYLFADADPRTWFSKSSCEENHWHPTMSKSELEVIHDLAIHLRARTDAKASADPPPPQEANDLPIFPTDVLVGGNG